MTFVHARTARVTARFTVAERIPDRAVDPDSHAVAEPEPLAAISFGTPTTDPR
jgi:hypothetical protein